ncbi:MAG: M15 family metallopeptidase [Pseudarcicella sp.]|nr:M15 family metallopeptidase [Pseudarcicella sp.]
MLSLFVNKLAYTAFFLLFLFSCHSQQNTNSDASSDEIILPKIYCDSTLRLKEISISEALGVFYKSQKLENISQKSASTLHYYVKNSKGIIKYIKVDKSGENEMVFSDQNGDSNKTLKTSEKIILGAMLQDEKYLYKRWESILENERKDFLQKRDSIWQILKQKHQSVKIISDIRSLSAQKKHLKNNKSVSPLSMHNFGFAADFAIFKGNKINNNFDLYKPLNQLTADYGLTWGGNFIGFIDPGHIQLFKNSAEMLEKYPDLIFEFAPYYDNYQTWLSKMKSWGKEHKARDTKEILKVLINKKLNKACVCNDSYGFDYQSFIKGYFSGNSVFKVQKDTRTNEMLIMFDLLKNIAVLKLDDETIVYKLGVWKKE